MGHGRRNKFFAFFGKNVLTGESESANMRGVLRGEIAQLVEQGTENPRVIGSIPILATIFFVRSRGEMAEWPNAPVLKCGEEEEGNGREFYCFSNSFNAIPLFFQWHETDGQMFHFAHFREIP